MDPIVKKAFTLLRKIRSVTFATINNNTPDARIADVMMVDDNAIYFLTARGKPYYHQLQKGKKVAICGMDKHYVTVRVTGDIKPCNDGSVVARIFEKNPKMSDLYPGKKRDILDAFCMCKGKGEIFDLSTHKPHRKRFAFGGESVNPSGVRIKDNCTACGLCIKACPTGCITENEIFTLDETRCLECGSCSEVCPGNAITAASGM